MPILSQGFFLLRRPQLPLNVFYEFNDLINRQPEQFEKEIIRFVSQPDMLEAIYVASPELYESFIMLIEGRAKTGTDKLLKTLYKYLVRMTSRSTPYGLFAGCALGKLGKQTRIAFDKNNPYRTHARLDMNYVAEMAEDMLKKDAVRGQLTYFVNTSLYPVGDQFRYVESYIKDKKRFHVLASVEASVYLKTVLAKAHNGATITKLANSIVSQEISQHEAEQYVHTIIDAQILVSELEPTVTGDEFFDTLIFKLEKLKGTKETVFKLKKIAGLLHAPNPGIGKYKEVESVIASHFVTTGSKDLIQTDLFYNTDECVLNENVLQILIKEYRNIETLGFRNPQPELEQFRKSFLDRYEQREMPLLQVLDNESGIGFGKLTTGYADNLPLLDDMQLPAEPATSSTEWTPLVKFREKLYRQAIAAGNPSVEITDAMLNELKKEISAVHEAPDSFYLFGNLLADSQQDVDDGNFRFAFHAMGGPSGLKLIGRFCHGNPELTNWVNKAVQQEERFDQDAIFAEIAHLPEARVGNVLMRPHLRAYEIPYLAGSSLPAENQIRPEELLISIAANGEIILRSNRLNKRIYPRLTNAHNFEKGLPVYRFLCELAYQNDHQYFAWNWNHLSSNTFLPRVTYKHWILSRAAWNLEQAVFSRLLEKEAAYVREWQEIRKTLAIPRYVQLRQADNEFLIDGESEISIKILCDAMRKYNRIKLTEFPEGTGKSVLADGKDHYVNEILIPLVNEKASLPATDTRKPIAIPANVKRSFMVGSEWLYVKIYAGTKTADRLLTSVIRPFTEKLLAAGTIEKWFFIRFADPDEHIRLRFYHASNPVFWNSVLVQLNENLQPMLENGTVQKMQIDTYKRELERYGPTNFNEIESVFFADSMATLGILNLLEGDEGEQYRWLLALRSVDRLLDDLHFDLAAKKQFMDHLQGHFFKEFKGNTELNVQLNDKYRTHSREIASFLNPLDDSSNELEEVIALLDERSERMKASFAVLQPELEITVDKLAGSLVHMSLNRIFVSRQRIHELVIYHYLKKYYESALARKEKNAGKNSLLKH